MFGSQIVFPVNVHLGYDPAADDVIPLFRAEKKGSIDSAYATMANDLAADGTNYFALNLLNGGAAGTATTAIGSTIGGTAGWTGLTPVSFSISSVEFAAGDVIVLNYNENGTGTFTSIDVQLNIHYGE